MSFRPGSEAAIDGIVAVQRTERAGYWGTVRERIGDRILVVSFPGASWGPFWIDVADVAVVVDDEIAEAAAKGK